MQINYLKQKFILRYAQKFEELKSSIEISIPNIDRITDSR